MRARTLELSQGFSLIESLIALVILSIAMLGIGGVFTGMLKDQRSALYRVKAVGLAADMAGRIRSNRLAGVAYSTASGGAAADMGCYQSASNENPTGCTPQNMAIHDRFEWQAAMAAAESGIPNGQATITFNQALTPPEYVINITWDEGYNYLAGEVSSGYSVTVRP